MGLYLKRDEQRSDVQQQVATDLQKRLRDAANEQPNEIEPAFLENQHTTRKAGVIIGVLIALLMIALVVFAIRIS